MMDVQVYKRNPDIRRHDPAGHQLDDHGAEAGDKNHENCFDHFLAHLEPYSPSVAHFRWPNLTYILHFGRKTSSRPERASHEPAAEFKNPNASLLRRFHLSDAADVQLAWRATPRPIAEMTLEIPHPYQVEMAERWISTLQGRFESGEEVVFAVTIRESARLVGAVGLELTPVSIVPNSATGSRRTIGGEAMRLRRPRRSFPTGLQPWACTGSTRHLSNGIRLPQESCRNWG